MPETRVTGVGIGFRRELTDALLLGCTGLPRFVEFAPENWMALGGHWGEVLRQIKAKYPILCHGLSLSVGSPDELDREFLADLKVFLDDVGAQVYSEHLSYTKCANAHLHDLLPLPFREDAARHAAQRIREVQDFLGRRIAIENVSYYTSVAPEMDEAAFIRLVVEEADCDLLLDVNNVYVNAFNHGYDAKEFLTALPLERVVYIHMAGHEQQSEELIIDSHGSPIVDPVYELFDWIVVQLHPVPVLLERDHNFPEMAELTGEMERLQAIVDRRWQLACVS